MNKMTFTKITGIFSTLFFAFAMTANALEVRTSGDVMTLDYTTGDIWMNIDNFGNGDMAATRQSIKKLVVIGEFKNTTAFTNSNDWAIETIDFSQATLPSQYSFKNLYSLKEIIWPATSFSIPSQAFQTDVNHSSLKTLTIPSNCTEVKNAAFANHAIETLFVEGPSTIFRYQSFNLVKFLKDVYVESGEETYVENGETKYYCEYYAFDPDITWVQTDIDLVADHAATLHIPADGNIENFRIKSTDVLTQAILNNTYKNQAKNGWQEFIKNSDAVVVSNTVFRTFSDTKEHFFPQCTDVEKGVKIYYVVGTKEVNGVNKLLIEPLNEKDGYTLPANTGVLVYTKSGLVIYNSDQTTDAPVISQYAAKTPAGNTNYLIAMQNAPETGANLYWQTVRDNVVSCNMFLNTKASVDATPTAWGFYGIYNKFYEKSEICYRAFLKMPLSMVEGNSMYGFYDGNGDVPPSVNGGKIFDLDVDDLSEATEIVTTKVDNQTSADNSYYNINGQKINEPANGLYIHAGKKYMK